MGAGIISHQCAKFCRFRDSCSVTLDPDHDIHAANLSDPGPLTDEQSSGENTSIPPGTTDKDQEKIMANLKDIVATLAILSSGTLMLTGCEKGEDASNNPDEKAAEDGGEAAAEGGEAPEGSCSGDKADGEGSCSGEAAADGEAACSGDKAEGGEAADGEASCSGKA